MKLFLSLSLVLNITASFANEKAYVCSSQCLGVEASSHTMLFLGQLDGVESTRLGAWKLLKKKCQRLANREGGVPVLARGSVLYSSDTSYGGSDESASSFESVRSFGYRSMSESESGASSYYQNDEITLKVDLAEMKDACSLEEVDSEDMQPTYDGDLPILG